MLLGVLIPVPISPKAEKRGVIVKNEALEPVLRDNTLRARGIPRREKEEAPVPERQTLAVISNPLVGREIKEMAKRYKTSASQITETCKGESGLRHQGVYGDNGLAYGIGQFHRGTFERFKPRSEMEYGSRQDQIETIAYMFSIGEQCHWTEWRKQFDSRNEYCGARGYTPL